MQKDKHPNQSKITAECSCGTKYEIHTILDKDFPLDVCSNCHPFYTGKQKILDSSGRVEKFKQRFS